MCMYKEDNTELWQFFIEKENKGMVQDASLLMISPITF